MKSNTTAIILAGILIGGAIMLSSRSSGGPNEVAPASNVSVVDGKQIVTITAKGGYAPRVSIAKPEIQTVLRVKTNGTFDCSSALTIPSIQYRTNLQPSGVAEIELPPQKAGTSLVGLCAMGMYNFEIKFQ